MQKHKKFRALAHHQRYAIVMALLDYGSMEIAELEKHLPKTVRQALNANLRILHRAGIVTFTPYPRSRILYGLSNPELIGHVMDKMEEV